AQRRSGRQVGALAEVEARQQARPRQERRLARLGVLLVELLLDVRRRAVLVQEVRQRQFVRLLRRPPLRVGTGPGPHREVAPGEFGPRPAGARLDPLARAAPGGAVPGPLAPARQITERRLL